MKTSQELAELFAKLSTTDGDGVATLARRIRHFENVGFLTSDSSKRDRRGTSQFNVIEACKARILSALVDFGLDKPTLAGALQAMAPGADGVNSSRDSAGNWISEPFWENEEAETFHIKNLPLAITRGDTWKLELKCLIQAGRPSVCGRFYDLSPRIALEDDAAEFRAYNGIELIGKLEIPASELCRPVVEAYGA